MNNFNVSLCCFWFVQGIDGLPGDKGDDGETGQPVSVFKYTHTLMYTHYHSHY